MNRLVYLLKFDVSRQTLRSTRAAIGPWILAGIWLALSISILLSLSLVRSEPALAQGGSNGIITHTTVADFGAVCGVLTDTTVSNADGGEIRLAASLEDYFNDTTIDSTKWISGSVFDTYPSLPFEAGGVVTLDASYLRSQVSFTQPQRFYEARALVQINSAPPGWPDIGFIRQFPPLSYTDPVTEASSTRLFIVPGDGTDLFARARDGNSLIDQPTPISPYTVFHEFRIEWGDTETDYYIDDILRATLPGTNTLPSWAWLYHHEPSTGGRSPIQFDWVRAGQYAGNGTYVSCTQDAGEIVNWTTLSATIETLLGTSVTFNTRTSLDGVNWSGWSPVNGSDITSPSGRYFQYRADLTGNGIRSPEVQEVTISYFGRSSLVVTPDPAVLNPGATQQFNAQVLDNNGDPISGWSISWQVVNGGGVINSAGLFTAVLSAGVYTDTVQANGAGFTTLATVIVNNAPPAADAGGPYTGNENQSVALNGSGSSDPNNDPLNFAWDLDKDGQFDDATGPTPTYTWPADGGYIIGLRVTDSGGLSDTVTTTVAIANLAPEIQMITINPTPKAGEPFTVTVTASDTPSDPLTYSFDWDSDGNYEIVDQTSNAASIIFSDFGSFMITVRVRDEHNSEDIETLFAEIAASDIFLPIIIR
jgi:hypothetical protein